MSMAESIPKVPSRLILLRHAKSDYPLGVPDHDRPLNERGRRDADAAGAWLAEHRDEIFAGSVTAVVTVRGGLFYAHDGRRLERGR